ncbi:MAG: glutamine--fructose-6-phosphate transaminase (isomerizing) [Clostridia bacterium]|nr:glutamine--fructose-6-phosphate transaminase (isomerizing) [Clostridia bacterium]
MCGIIGYTGKKQATEIIIKGLKSLEYRGYDSSGIAVFDGENIQAVKKEGRIVCLEKELETNPLSGNTAIGHTRWATHGKPSDSNAHPFVSTAHKFAVVHNGIIENYLEIKEYLQARNIHFYSQTDSEVVAHLIEYLYIGDVKDAILSAVRRLRGSFALGVISSAEPGIIFAVKKDNPLIIGKGENENYISSDITSLQKFTGSVVVLKNYQLAKVTASDIELCDFDGCEQSVETVDVSRELADDTHDFESFMEKEIREIPAALTRALKGYVSPFGEAEYWQGINRIYFIGCGTALHAGMVGKRILKKLLPELNLFAEMASEFRYDDFHIDEHTLTIAVSQSGETADTLSCIRMVKERGGKVLCVCNVPISSIVFESDFALFTNAGPEVAVASTKAYNCQLAVLTMFALDFARLKGALTKQQFEGFMADMGHLPEKAEETLKLNEFISDFSSWNYTRKSVFYLGRGLDYYVAMEGSLKLKEISYIQSEAYAAGELKHGTLALIEDGVLVMALVTQRDLLDKMHSSLIEVKSRGATIITITPFGDNAAIKDVSDYIIPIPNVTDILYPVISVIPTQLFSYYIARAKGCDIDKPRNLAKSVTVE